MKRAILWLAAFAGLAGAGASGAACSSSSGVDSGTDSGAPDATLDGTGNDGSGGDAPTGDGGIFEAAASDGPLANCSAVRGECDLVSQNCGSGKECRAVAAKDGGEVAACVATQLSQHIGKGHACCPSGNTNPCDPGLECIGNACDPDAGGVETGRCTPHCCLGPDGGDDTPCGSSNPEGYPGHCDLSIVDNQQNPLYAVCTYSQICRPFHVEPCMPGYACIVQGVAGGAACTQIYNPQSDAGQTMGATEGQSCGNLNACADGLECFGTADAGSSCFLLCYVTGQQTPFPYDAGASPAPGYGGCTATRPTCNAVANLLPPWLGVCE